MSFRLHSVLLPAPSAAATLGFDEDFSVVGGIGADGALLPVAVAPANCEYVVTGGIKALAYTPRLGRLGAHLDFSFPAPAAAVLVATYSDVAPVPLIVLKAGPAAIIGTLAGFGNIAYTTDGQSILSVDLYVNSADGPHTFSAKYVGSGPGYNGDLYNQVFPDGLAFNSQHPVANWSYTQRS